MTVRGLLGCERRSLQEFARIVIVDDLTNYTKKVEYHEPLLDERPTWASMNSKAIVSLHSSIRDFMFTHRYRIDKKQLFELSSDLEPSSLHSLLKAWKLLHS